MGRDLAWPALASGASEVVARVLGIVLAIAVARMLEPSEVGVLGLSTILVGVVSQVAYCVETACVTGRSVGSDGQYAVAAFSIRAVITVALVGGLLFALPQVTRLLAGSVAAELELLVRLLLWQLLVETAGTYPRVLLQRQLRLTSVALAMQVGVIMHVGLAVLFLVAGFGAVGVVWACLIGAIASGLCLWLQVGGRYALLPESRIAGHLWQEAGLSAGKVLVGGILGYVNGRVDNLLVAGILGPAAMSFYSMAWTVSRIPASILHQVLNFVLIPTLAKIQKDRESVEEVLQGALRYSYVVLSPVCAGLFVSAPSVVASILGPKWLPLVPCLRIMSITVLMGPLVSSTSALLIGIDRAHVTGLATLGQFVVLGVLIVPLAMGWNIIGAAFGDLFAVIVLTVILYVSGRFAARYYRPRLVSAILPPLVAACSAGVVSAYVGSHLEYGRLRAASELSILLAGYTLLLGLVGGSASLAGIAKFAREAVRYWLASCRRHPVEAP